MCFVRYDTGFKIVFVRINCPEIKRREGRGEMIDE
jgi:hypothetical protein